MCTPAIPWRLRARLRPGPETWLLVLVLLWSSHAAAATLTGTPLILDAATLLLSGERIRLKGIDAPEATQACRDATGHAYSCGQVAAHALMDKIGTAPIRCVGTERDQHHRLQATCYLNDLDLNRWLVQQGHALVYGTDSPHYLDAEKEAKNLTRGIWAGPFTPREWRQHQPSH